MNLLFDILLTATWQAAVILAEVVLLIWLLGEPHRNVPKRHELEPTRLGCRLVGRTFFTALRANAQRILAWNNFHADPMFIGFLVLLPNLLNHEGLVIRHGIE